MDGGPVAVSLQESAVTSVQWRVAWLALARATRVRYFDTEAEAREWFRYVTTGWGPAATARISSRVVGPWEEDCRLGPGNLDMDHAKVMP